MNKHQTIAALLSDLELELKVLSLWSDLQPSAQDLSSTQPFCVDTLNFTQWLQFILIPRLNQIVVDQAMLPRQCDVHPMAEEYFKPQSIHAEKITTIIKSIDDCINKKS